MTRTLQARYNNVPHNHTKLPDFKLGYFLYYEYQNNEIHSEALLGTLRPECYKVLPEVKLGTSTRNAHSANQWAIEVIDETRQQ